MEGIVKVGVCILTCSFQRSPGCGFAVSKPRRNVHFTLGEGAGYRIKPSVNPGFAGVNLLPSANQTNDDRPLLLPVHVGNQKIGL